MPPAATSGLANAASHAGKTVPVAGGNQTLGEDEESGETGETEETGEAGTGETGETEEEVGEDAEPGDDRAGGAHSTTDPTALTEEELAAMNHGLIACWAAHQESCPGVKTTALSSQSWAHAARQDPSSGQDDGQGQGKAMATASRRQSKHEGVLGSPDTKGPDGRPAELLV